MLTGSHRSATSSAAGSSANGRQNGASAPGAGDRRVPDSAGLSGARSRVLLDELLEHLLERGGSDLHLSAGAAPSVRVRGEMEPVDGFGPLSSEDIQRAVYAVLTTTQRDRFEEALELDCSYAVAKSRFRVNVMRQQGAVSAVFRAVPWEIKTLNQLGLPERLSNLSALHRGLVLVTGPTGSGKSTTVATLIDTANRTRHGHIVTIEDPIEFVFEHKGCIVNQREVGEDTRSFAEALKHVLRQDPDIIVVGEMRDLETISTALTAAETGHLVFATLHTRSAQEAVTRIVDAYPAGQQAQVRAQLASSLQGVVAQTLLRTADGLGRVAAAEILIATPAIRNLIRENKLTQIGSALESGAAHGMQTLDQSLAQLVLQRKITKDAARQAAHDATELESLIRGGQGRLETTTLSASRMSDVPGF